MGAIQMTDATDGDRFANRVIKDDETELKIVDAEVVEIAPDDTLRTRVRDMRRRAQRYEAARLADATMHGV
jgi:hypothetical protein